MKAKRPQLQQSDVSEPERLCTVLNEILLAQSVRIEALEALKGIYVLPDVEFTTEAAVSLTNAPFANNHLRITCPFPPTGLVLLRLQPIATAAGGAPISTSASDVKWRFAGGPGGAAEGVLIINFITGLAVSTRYQMRLGVTRA